MMGICEMCKLRTRIDKKLKVCAPCRRNFNEVVDEFFDGDPFMPLKIMVADMRAKGGSK